MNADDLRDYQQRRKQAEETGLESEERYQEPCSGAPRCHRDCETGSWIYCRRHDPELWEEE